MTTYIAAYDTELPECLTGVRRIVEMHERFDMPATFFMVAGLLDDQGDAYASLLRDHPLFEIACHTWSHMPLVDTPRFGLAGPPERYPRELVDSKRRLEDVFGCPVIGFRPPVCAPTGLTTAPGALEVLRDAGYRYVSSVAWGPDFSLPAPLTLPFSYREQGFPELWELPACGWHENLLKGHNECGPLLLCMFPPEMPETIPDTYVKTPEEEFAVNNRPFLDKAVRTKMPLVSFIWHPWSLHRFDSGMHMLEITFEYVASLGMHTDTFAGLMNTLSNEPR
jgi:hypothetical protein